MLSTNGYFSVRAELKKRISEPAPSRIQILTGPRQVGKTTLLLDLARSTKIASRYLALDAPEASIPGWWDRQWELILQVAGEKKVLLLLDEVQFLPDWTRVVKSAVDQIYRMKIPVHIIATGSSALKVGAGAKETMAGRFERLAICHWAPSDIQKAFRLTPKEAVTRYLRFGGFPGGMNLISDLQRWRAYIRDSIMEPAIGRDLIHAEKIRKPSLFRQVFGICTKYPSEIVSLGKIGGALLEEGTLDTISQYLEILQEAYLVAPIRKFSRKEIRRRASPPKLIPLSNAFLAASGHENLPTHQSDPQAWGRWVETACIAFLINSGLTVHYWREEPFEVDVVVENADGEWAIEIKSGAFSGGDLRGLFEFCKKFPSFTPIVICENEHQEPARRSGVQSLSFEEFFSKGLPASRNDIGEELGTR